MPSKWKKEIVGAWRMDVNIDIEERGDEDNELDNESSASESELDSDDELSSDNSCSDDSD